MHRGPYVVSADIKLLLAGWAERKGFRLPDDAFFANLRDAFNNRMREIFPWYEFIGEDDIRNGMQKMAEISGLTAISLDRAYFGKELFLDTTRCIDANLNSQGLFCRSGFPPVEEQIENIRKSGVTEAILVDDVIYTGTGIVALCHKLEAAGIKIPAVCAGIGVADGMKIITDSNRHAFCAILFENLIDEVCERDFYPGVPMSGRQVGWSGANVGVPYILPFGKIDKWASIPHNHHRSFSEFCIKQTISLFEEIEKASGKPVMCDDLERKVHTLPHHGARFVDELKALLNKG